MRKQIYNLTDDDLLKFAVWEFALDEEDVDEQDEATVRPVIEEDVSSPVEQGYVIRALFTLADGSKFVGHLTVPEQAPGAINETQPAIATAHGQVSFWYGMFEPSQDQIAAKYALLGKRPEHVFPLKYQSDVPVTTGLIEGAIGGFLFLKNWKTSKEISTAR